MLCVQGSVNCAELNFLAVHVHPIVQNVAKFGKKKQVKERGKGAEQLDQSEASTSVNGAELNISSIPVDKNTVPINASMKQCWSGNGNTKRGITRHLDKILKKRNDEKRKRKSVHNAVVYSLALRQLTCVLIIAGRKIGRLKNINQK